MLVFFFLSFQILYAFFTLLMWLGWQRIARFQPPTEAVPTTRISIIIVVRNEEKNLPTLFASLKCQSYPAPLVEVYVVDDFSTDATVEILRQQQSQVPFRLHILQLKDYVDATLADGSFKKKGIEWAVNQSDAELIVMTDGDCTVPPHWLARLAAFHSHTQAQMICGGVTFTTVRNSIFANLQTIEFASLIGSGAATLQFGIPTMCNAANLAFTREAFVQVGGYRDTASTATGDDLFLMHKIFQKYPTGVHFLKNPDSTVGTPPQETIADFYQQRKRWASKWNLYQDWRVSFLAVFVFLCNLAIPAGIAAVLLEYLSLPLVLSGLFLRWVTEWFFLGSILHYLKHKSLLGWLLLAQLVYPAYVIFFGIAVQRKGYHWKGRQLSA